MHFTPSNESILEEMMDLEYEKELILKKLPKTKSPETAREYNLEIAHITMKELRLIPRLKDAMKNEENNLSEEDEIENNS